MSSYHRPRLDYAGRWYKQRDLIDHAATLLGKNRPDFMVEVARKRATAIILARRGTSARWVQLRRAIAGELAETTRTDERFERGSPHPRCRRP
ncbi:DUF1778 domain-containing protein [Paraburkholderia humisilvae]|uniref:type II toxin -antitoxin system TacA 1-like antitoxin n=1 Tax=Paraburkholderia humisilvae TaxID=627669 RepID=UPI00158243F5|nr:DUF1778 domain-containing protein [Paraburkholderia humisilvae]